MIIPPVRPYFPREDMENIKERVDEILSSGMLSTAGGKYVTEFERMFGKFVGTKYAIATNSGTSAIQCSLESQYFEKGFQAIIPTNTFSATAMAVLHANGVPVFVDIDPKTLSIDIHEILDSLTDRSKAIITVHIGGIVSPDINDMVDVCAEHDLFLIEDAAHAHGSTFKGQKAGSFGSAGCFSFSPTKVMTAGEGGIITTDDSEINSLSRRLRDEGRSEPGSVLMTEMGFSWRLPEINAAIGIIQLRRLEEMIGKKRSIAQVYDSALKNVGGIEPFKIPNGCKSSYYKYITFLDDDIDRDSVKSNLRDKGILCPSEVYDPPLHLQPFYKGMFKTKEGDFPVAERVSRQMMCLPIFPSMNTTEVTYVVTKLREALEET